MNPKELELKLGELIKTERRITNEILLLLNTAEAHGTYLELGYASLFDWLTKGFGYSNASAYRRIEAARLIKTVPEAKEQLESGSVNLTTLCKVQKAIKHHEKQGELISREDQTKIIAKLANKSSEDTDRMIFEFFPETASEAPVEKKLRLSEDLTRLSVNLTNEDLKNLQRIRELLSHRWPSPTDAVLIGHVLREFLKKQDPLQKPTSAAEATRVRKSKASLRREVFHRSHGACTFRDPVTGKICGSRHQVQVDHIRPRALGGDDAPENLRLLCRKHNFWMAERNLGLEKMAAFRGT